MRKEIVQVPENLAYSKVKWKNEILKSTPYRWVKAKMMMKNGGYDDDIGLLLKGMTLPAELSCYHKPSN